ncbi:hypothetical protein [Streptomyces angustmyceticus]|uniref:hypothetical protein n=1 Tax=Streptomyces angustmyceticus TaxID=285578 RepID=UPI0021B0443E|nr:hypothetical protein [Streptomyces angustmyceticus]
MGVLLEVISRPLSVHYKMGRNDSEFLLQITHHGVTPNVINFRRHLTRFDSYFLK